MFHRSARVSLEGAPTSAIVKHAMHHRCRHPSRKLASPMSAVGARPRVSTNPSCFLQPSVTGPHRALRRRLPRACTCWRFFAQHSGSVPIPSNGSFVRGVALESFDFPFSDPRVLLVAFSSFPQGAFPDEIPSPLPRSQPLIPSGFRLRDYLCARAVPPVAPADFNGDDRTGGRGGGLEQTSRRSLTSAGEAIQKRGVGIPIRLCLVRTCFPRLPDASSGLSHWLRSFEPRQAASSSRFLMRFPRPIIS